MLGPLKRLSKWLRSYAIEEAEGFGDGMAIANTSFILWNEDVSALSDLNSLDLELLLDQNGECADLEGTDSELREPYLNYLRLLACKRIGLQPRKGGSKACGASVLA